MVSPKPGELEKLQTIVAKQQERARELPYPHFDENKGWGHVIRPPDKWWTINKQHTRRRWKFVGSHAGTYDVLFVKQMCAAATRDTRNLAATSSVSTCHLPMNPYSTFV